MSDWQQNRRGELVLGPTNQIGWLRLPSNSSIFESTADPSAGPKSGHYEFITTVSVYYTAQLDSVVFNLTITKTGRICFILERIP